MSVASGPQTEAEPAPENGADGGGMKIQGAPRGGGGGAQAQAVFGRLAGLLQMEERLRRADKKELPFIVVNETRLLAPYRQAVLWRLSDPADSSPALPGFQNPSPLAVSGLAGADKNSPYLQWLTRLGRHQHQAWLAAEPSSSADGLAFTSADLPPELAADWAEWLPAHGFFLPLPLWPPEAAPFGAVSPDGAENPEAPPPVKSRLFGYLTLFGQEALSTADRRILAHLSGAYGQALSLAFTPRQGRLWLTRRWRLIAAAVLLIMLLPVRQSVLAPAEVIAQDPWPVRSPLDGVVENILVEPNAQVGQGEALLKLDTTELSTRLAVAEKSLEIARVELRQARQQAFADREAKLRLAYLSGRVEQLTAEKDYVESLLARALIKSPIDGLALVDAPDEWAGKPVTLGQRIMTVADPASVRLEIFVPMDDYLVQAPGDTILFFPNVSPGSPLAGTLYQVAFQAQETPQAALAFRLRADFDREKDGDPPPRLGVRGSAKLYGRRAPLIYVILRKPIVSLRQWLGF